MRSVWLDFLLPPKHPMVPFRFISLILCLIHISCKSSHYSMSHFSCWYSMKCFYALFYLSLVGINCTYAIESCKIRHTSTWELNRDGHRWNQTTRGTSITRPFWGRLASPTSLILFNTWFVFYAISHVRVCILQIDMYKFVLIYDWQTKQKKLLSSKKGLPFEA